MGIATHHRWTVSAAITLLLLIAPALGQQSDPLPSWNDGAAKSAIVAFVQGTTTQGSPQFVPQAERIAAFDQDGAGRGLTRS